MQSFMSDYQCIPHPAVVQAVVDACSRPTEKSYGEDDLTRSCQKWVREHFGQSATAYFVLNGTAANRLALQTVLGRPYEAIFCSEHAHINRHEAGAVESLGHKLIPVSAPDGKINVLELDRYVRQQQDIHMAHPRVLSISNPTELGTVYDPEEIDDICAWTLDNDLFLHIDGARFPLAVGADSSLLETALGHDKLGPIVLTLGGTKIGGMLGDAVICFHSMMVKDAIRLQKQAGQLAARTHCIAAQMNALYCGDLWRQNALNANTKAKSLAGHLQARLDWEPVYPVQSNAVFVRVGQPAIRKLQQHFPVCVWDEPDGIIRWMCSWNTTDDDIKEFVQAVEDTLHHG